MRAKWRVWAIVGLSLALGVCFLFHADSAAEKKNNDVWKAIVPKEENEERVARGLSSIQKELGALATKKAKDFKIGLRKIRATALAIAAVAQSNAAIAKDQKLATLRDIALQLSVEAGKKNV